jgi:hypothetical protein
LRKPASALDRKQIAKLAAVFADYCSDLERRNAADRPGAGADRAARADISHHLKVLTDAGLIERDKGVVWAYNRAVPATLQMIADLVAPPVD